MVDLNIDQMINSPDPSFDKLVNQVTAEEYLKRNPPGPPAGAVQPIPSSGESMKGEFIPIDSSDAALSQQLMTLQKQEAGLLERKKAAEAPVRQQIESKIATPAPSYQRDVAGKRVEQPPVPPPVDPKEFQTFSGMAMLFAALAGRTSREPLTASLNAYAGAIKGYYKGSQDQWNDNMKIWKEKSEEALRKNEELSKAYEAAINERGLTLNELEAKLKLISNEYGDEIAKNEMQQKGILGFMKLKYERDVMAYRLSYMRWRLKQDYHLKSATAEEMSQAKKLLAVRPEWNQLSDAQQQSLQAEVASEAKTIMQDKNVDFATAANEVVPKILKNPLYKPFNDSSITKEIMAGLKRHWDNFKEDIINKAPKAPAISASPANRDAAKQQILDANPGVDPDDPRVDKMLNDQGF